MAVPAPKPKRSPRSRTAVPQQQSSEDGASHEAVKAPQAKRMPNGVPSVYADQIMDIVYGLHTSKIVLGVENGIGGLRPVGVVVVPTATLLHTASNVVRDLTSPSIIEETSKRMSSYIAMMNDLNPTKKTK